MLDYQWLVYSNRIIIINKSELRRLNYTELNEEVIHPIDINCIGYK